MGFKGFMESVVFWTLDFKIKKLLFFNKGLRLITNTDYLFIL